MGAFADVEHAKASRNIRRGKGKMRNRRYVGRKGPLVVFGAEANIGRAFRNLPGVEVASVDRLNLLQVRIRAFRSLGLLKVQNCCYAPTRCVAWVFPHSSCTATCCVVPHHRGIVDKLMHFWKPGLKQP